MTDAKRPNSRRTHDLIDLQLIEANAEVDLEKTKATCLRLFAYRRRQAWPPTVVKNDGWDERYASQSAGLGVLPTADEAIAWANALIARIDSAV